ncbi:MAG: hypothetical protein R3344_00115 [Acidobacteriota bacterium]|nr:hypothetical protein [Acidobacteriota bacterium]
MRNPRIKTIVRLVLLAAVLSVLLTTTSCSGGNVYVGVGVAGPYWGYPVGTVPGPYYGGPFVIGYP